MSGVYWAVLAVTIVVGSIAALRWAGRGRDRATLTVFLAGLPLSYMINEFVKVPLTPKAPFTSVSGPPAWGFLLPQLWISPVVEEAAKLLQLTLPGVRATLPNRESLVRADMAAGFGFGLGEAWYFAWGRARTAAYSSLPFLALTGYVSERLIMTFAHAAMTAIAVTGFSGYAKAVAFHALINFGPLAYQLDLIGAPVRSFLTLVSIGALIVVFDRVRRSAIV